jgi:hypothetical protein
MVAARLERVLGEHTSGPLDVPVLGILTDMQVACGNLAAATRTANLMVELTTPDPVDALVGYARQGTACVAAACTGGSGSGVEVALKDLEAAIAAFTAARLPLEAAGASDLTPPRNSRDRPPGELMSARPETTCPPTRSFR